LRIVRKNIKETTEEIQDDILVTTPTHGTFLSKCMSTTGDIKSCEPITVEGHVVGNIKCEDIVVVLSGGSVTGKIEAKEIRIDGRVEGAIEASIIEQLKSAKNEGSLLADIIILNGTSDGNILCRETLEIGKDATVKSDECKADIATINGDFSGNIRVSKLIEMQESSNLKGSLKANELKSEIGCKISASIEIVNKKEEEI